MSAPDLITIFEQTVTRCGARVSVSDEAGTLSYAELHELAKRFACAFVRCGVDDQRGVVVVAEKSGRTLAAMLGALMGGSFYVPVDPFAAPERVRSLLETLGDSIVAADEDGRTLLANAGYDGSIIDLEAAASESADAALLEQARATWSDDAPAYVMFTSGSTGSPKGVVVSRRSVRSFIASFVNAFGIDENDVIANQAPFDFDVSVKDIYSALFTGATLALIPRRLFSAPAQLAEFLAERECTVMVWAVAALCILSGMRVLEPGMLPSVRFVGFSGEVMPVKHLRAWTDALPGATFANLYGPTEVTCNCTYCLIDRERDYCEGIPLGRAFAGRDVFLLGDDGSRLDVCAENAGVEGEIVVGGGIASGYIGSTPADDARFCHDPLLGACAGFPSSDPGAREGDGESAPDDGTGDAGCSGNAALFYRTGDIGRVTQGGEVVFAGRRDNQIKLAGSRIELEEVDALMERHPGIARCRCAHDAERQRIVAFIEGDIAPRDAKIHARTLMKGAMVPAKVVVVNSMPLNKNGKVDRRALLLSASAIR